MPFHAFSVDFPNIFIFKSPDRKPGEARDRHRPVFHGHGPKSARFTMYILQSDYPFIYLMSLKKVVCLSVLHQIQVALSR